jgi:hypothetical protein
MLLQLQKDLSSSKKELIDQSKIVILEVIQGYIFEANPKLVFEPMKNIVSWQK